MSVRRGIVFVVAVVLLLATTLVAPFNGYRAVGMAAPATNTYKNPVDKQDFPDPFVLKAGKTYYAYATNGNNENIQTLYSADLVHWRQGKDAMPVTATWIASDIWAPTVLHRSDGTYLMYYSAHSIKIGRECLGLAVSRSPAGPFRDTSSKPFLCQTNLGGTIDPTVLQDRKGALYLYYKNDGNCCGLPASIWGQRLSSNGAKVVGKASKLVTNDQSWEGQVVEGPTMWKHASKYFLFFSANAYDSPSYAVGYATCKGPMGPCTEAKKPVLTSGCNAAGPGGETIITDNKGQTWMLYHAWPANNIGYPGSERMLFLDRLNWVKGLPVVKGPTCTPQPDPATKG